MAERTLFLIKPDAVRAQADRRDPRPHGGSRPHDPRGEAPDGRPRAGRDALRGALREAVLRRARRLHHLGADAGARARGRVRDPGRAHDDGRHEPRRRGARARSAATSRSRCRTTSSTDRIRPSRPRARSRSGSPTLTDVPDSVARNAAAWDGYAAEYVEAGRRNWESNEPDWGIWSIPESEIGFLAERGRSRRRRAGLRDRVRLLVGGAARRPAGRRRPVHRAARDRAAVPGGVRGLVPARSGRRRGGAAARRVVRPRLVRVRREHLGRSGSLDPRGGAASAPGWAARVPADLAAARPVLAGGRKRARRRPSCRRRTSAGSGGSSGPTRTAASSTSSRTAR